MGNRKDSKWVLVDQITKCMTMGVLQGVINSIILLVILGVKDDSNSTRNFIIIIAVVVFTVISKVIYSILSYNKKTYRVDDEYFYYNYGIVFKKNIKLPISSILGVDVSESIHQRMFKLQKLSVDRGLSEDSEDINLVMKKREAMVWREKLLKYKDIDESLNYSENLPYNMKFIDVVKFSLIKSQLDGALIALVGIIYIKQNFEKQFSDTIDMYNAMYNKYFVLLFLLVIFILISKTISIFTCINKYYNFTVVKNGEKIEISRGLLIKQTSSIDTSKICAVKTRQNAFQKRANTSTVIVLTGGFSDGDNEEAIALLNIDNDLRDRILDEVIGDMVYRSQTTKVNKGHKISYRNSSIGYDDRLLYITGGIFKNHTNTILIREIDNVEIIENPKHRKLNTRKIRFDHKAQDVFGVRSVNGIDADLAQKIKEMIETY